MKRTGPQDIQGKQCAINDRCSKNQSWKKFLVRRRGVPAGRMLLGRCAGDLAADSWCGLSVRGCASFVGEGGVWVEKGLGGMRGMGCGVWGVGL